MRSRRPPDMVAAMAHPAHAHSHPDAKARPEEKLGWALQICRDRGLRRTRALEELLRELIECDRPATLAELAESPRLHGVCDRVTVYRLLQRLEQKGLVRRLGLHERAAYFIIKYPGEHHDFLICTECGSIDKLG